MARPRLGVLDTIRNVAVGFAAGFRASSAGVSIAAGPRAYEGATTGRRLSNWGTGVWGPNAATAGSLSNLRARSRELVRNNPWMSRAADSHVANLVGTGILPRFPEPKELLRAAWNRWAEESDADGVSNFYGQQALVARTVFESGEAIVRFRPRPSSYGLSVPLQLQVLEPDHLDESKDGPLASGNVVTMGVERTTGGIRVAYWLRREHPGEPSFMSGNAFSGETVRVPASEVLHIFHRKRPNQLRGIPRISAALLRLYELDQYEDAEIVRKKAAAMIGGFIEEAEATSSSSPILLGTNEGTDADGDVVAGFKPGTFALLPPGMKAHFSNYADVGAGYVPFNKQQLRAIAAGLGITYEQLTGDLSDVNYSSIRAGIVEMRRQLEQQIHEVMVFQLCRPVVRRWMEFAVATGALELDVRDFLRNRAKYFDVAWRPQRWAWVDPLKDVAAAKEAVRNGFQSRASVVAELGEDVEDVDREIAADNARADRLGLILDSDPRHTASSGAGQAAAGDDGEQQQRKPSDPEQARAA